MGDRVGQAGIEAEYDRFLRGRNGAARVEVDALGNLTKTLKRRRAAAGQPAAPVARPRRAARGQQALAGGTGRGAFAVMDVNNGEVVALGSQPSFDPNIFTKPISQKRLDALSSEELGKPLFNRAIQGGYPTGSTFKLVTATAALESGHITPGHRSERPGLAHGRRRDVRERRRRRPRRARAAPGAHGLERRLLLPARPGHEREGHAAPAVGAPARHRAARPASTCRPRSRAGCRRRRWRRPLVQAGPAPTGPGPWATTSTSRSGRATCSPTRSRWRWPTRRSRTAAACCGRGSACGSRTPPGRALQQLDAPDRAAAEDLDGEPPRDPRGPPRRRERARAEPRRRSSRASRSRSPARPAPPSTCGKADQSWYVALAPYPNPKYVVAVTDEAGGFGADTAAPMARRILAELFDVKETGLVQGGGAPD